MWGLSFPAKSVGLEYLPPLVFAAFRYDIAVVLLLGYDVATTDSWRSVGRNNVEAILGGGVFLIAGNGLLFVGQQTIPSGDVAILQALVPGMAALSALLLVDEGLLGGRRRRRRTRLPRRLLDGAGVPHLLHHPRCAGAFEASLVAYLVPMVATVAGVLLLEESVGVLSVDWFVVVFPGFALLKRRALADVGGAGVS